MREPGHVGIDRFGVGLAARLTLLVLPVRRHAELGLLVHFVRADLDLDRATARTDDRGVERLVEVELRGGDVILEPTGQRRPASVDGAQDRIAVADAPDEDADADEVVDVVELTAPHDHLLVHGVELLGAAHHASANAQCAQVLVDRVDDVLDVLFALRGALLDETFDLDVELGVQNREREVFELGLDRLDAEAVCQRGVDLERLGGLLVRLLGRNESPRSRVVQAVGQFDQEHADVSRHRDDHLADGLCLRAFAVLDLVELGDTIHEHRDLVAELGGESVEGVTGVFDRVVQQGSRDGLRAQAQLGEDLGDGKRVRDVRLTALARLPCVGDVSRCVGPLDDRQITLGMVRANGPEQLLHAVATNGTREDPRHEAPERRRLRGRDGLGHRVSSLRWISQSYARAGVALFLRRVRRPVHARRSRARRVP